MTPAVSVVVPVYNLEFYIDRCLASVANQTFEQFEAIIVNDGGTDDSQLIIDEYVQKYPHIFRPYTKPNGGHGSACNFGIELARGEYIMILDGDDFIDPDTIEFMYSKATESNADLLIGNLLYIFSDHTAPYIPIPIQGEKLLSDDERGMLFRNWPTPCGRLYHRSIFADKDVKFLPGVIFADANFVPKSYLAAKNIYYVNRELYNYDITRPTQSIKQTDKRIMNIVPVLRDMLDFYKKKNAFDQNQMNLMYYVVRHCVSWIPKIRTLTGYSKKEALKEIFAVADETFDNSWVNSGIVQESFGRRAYWQLKIARTFGYAPILWGWAVTHRWYWIDARIESLLNVPLRGYRWAKRKFGTGLSRLIGG
ncbi:hypothetical protein CAP48_05570 [Advenella sp. S44]|uniref:glycosyltransferase family 2 protein n=1 Tax=Advenella sp. S44 TaxID=1982755 RepID=UPI000C2B3CF8|nr:glycosyltransferase family A protein [Advenella sp. S44]PJX25514.1 hypothetical protein CAP48_05570 [Advenella sp. S44]